MSRSIRALARTAAVLAVAMISAIQPGCAGCNERAPLEFVPADAVGVVVVPKLSTLLTDLRGLSANFRKSLLSGALIDRQAALLKNELGFDPDNPETLKKLGVDPEGGLALFFGAKGEVGIVLPMVEQKALDGTLRRQLSRILRGDALYKPGQSRGVKLTTVSTHSKKRVGAWAFVGKHVVIGGSSHGGAAELVGRLCKLERSMKKDNATFAAARKQVGDADIFGYLDGNGARGAMGFQAEQALAGASGWTKQFIAERKQTGEAALRFFQGLAVGLTPSTSGLELAAYYAAPKERVAALREVFSGVGDAVPFGKLIAPDALVVARGSLNAKKLLERAVEILPSHTRKRIYGRLERMAREDDFSLEKDVLPLLAGRFAAAVYPPSSQSVQQLLRGTLSLAQLAPAVFIAQISDPKRAGELLVRLERFLVLRGAEVRVRGEGARRVFTVERGGRPVASWTATPKLFVLASGGRLEKTIELAEKGGENVLAHLQSKAAKAALKEDEGLLFSANMAKIGEALRAMDLGLEGKVLLAPVQGTLGRFKEITFTAAIAEEGLLAKLAVVLQ